MRVLSQRVHIHYYYGSRSRKTILIMGLGRSSLIVVCMDPLGVGGLYRILIEAFGILFWGLQCWFRV